MLRPLPDNINLLTLSKWRGSQLLIRLEHIYQSGDENGAASPVTINLKVGQFCWSCPNEALSKCKHIWTLKLFSTKWVFTRVWNQASHSRILTRIRISFDSKFHPEFYLHSGFSTYTCFSGYFHHIFCDQNEGSPSFRHQRSQRKEMAWFDFSFCLPFTSDLPVIFTFRNLR